MGNTRKAKVDVKPKMVLPVADICRELQAHERMRVWYLKSRIMNENRLRATVANMLGYFSGQTEAERKKGFAEADKIIKDIDQEKRRAEGFAVVQAGLLAIHAFHDQYVSHCEAMEDLAKQLPVIEWVNEPEQRGFGVPNLSIVIGEAGNLDNYAGPAKLWRRFGLAPIEKEGRSQMPATWRGGENGKLTAAEWETAGYSPHRRSIAFNVGEPLIKSNGEQAERKEDGVVVHPFVPCGPYRERYDETKASIAKAHPDYTKMRCHRHGHLLMTKLLFKNLWVAWREYR